MADSERTSLIRPSRRLLLLAAAAAPLAAPAYAAPPSLLLTGPYVQGGFAFGRTTPRATILVDGVVEGAASADGAFFVGFDRDSPSRVTIAVRTPEGEASHVQSVAPRSFDIQRIDGLPPDQIAPQDPALLARIAAEAERKAAGFASRLDREDFVAGFILPVEGARITTRFGGQRILNGQPKTPHYGVDLAAPVGTPVRAPADGVVAFAETGLHFDGGLILIDHGQGLISAYLHLSRIDVARGEQVRRGQLIGAVGQEGRATGPHLCWRLKWHGRNLDPLLMVGAEAPAKL